MIWLVSNKQFYSCWYQPGLPSGIAALEKLIIHYTIAHTATGTLRRKERGREGWLVV